VTGRPILTANSLDFKFRAFLYYEIVLVFAKYSLHSEKNTTMCCMPAKVVHV